MNLRDLGWSSDWADYREDEGDVIRITSQQRGSYQGINATGAYQALLSGKLEFSASSQSELPTIGDWCVVSAPFMDSQGESVIIHKVLPRRSKIARIAAGNTSEEQVLAANVDLAFIVSSVNHELNINRIHRYVFLAKSGGIEPVIVLSKIDLIDHIDSITESLKQECPNIKIVTVSSYTSKGIDEIKKMIPRGETTVFLGSSGVGKSTLVNSLLGHEVQETKIIREADSKGRHTTTSRTIFFLAEGGMIIDTPGLRELQILGSEELLSEMYEGVESIANQCEFSSCNHANEPGCAVQEALKKGTLTPEDLKRYEKMQRELAYNRRRVDKRESSNTKKRWKQIHLEIRQKRSFEDK